MVDFIIINAIAPSIYMYDDRIEVVSYGGLPHSLSIEGFFFGTGVPVNKSLLTIFMAAKYTEQSDHGVLTIVEKYGRRAFSFDNGMIKVTIPLAFEGEELINRTNKENVKNNLIDNQKYAYEFMSSNIVGNLQEVADAPGLSLDGVKKICSKLKEYGLLERKGSKRDGIWVTK